MRAPNEILSCVAYIYATNQQGDSDNPIGTAFFVSVPSESLQEKRHTYLVTAKHLLLKSTGLSLQYNSKGGKRKPARLPNAQQWYKHPDKGIDIAALLLDDDYEWLADVEYEGVPIANFAHHMDVGKYDPIGIGDDLLVTGLFVSQPGDERNIPIVRAGIISAVPGDLLGDVDKNGEVGPPYTAYLAELHSTGGLSGSPVFVVIGPVRMVHTGNDDLWNQAGGVGTMSIGLLGVIRGHFRDPRGDPATAGALGDPGGQVNRGIAKVTPIEFLEEILMDETKSSAKADRVERDGLAGSRR